MVIEELHLPLICSGFLSSVGSLGGSVSDILRAAMSTPFLLIPAARLRSREVT